MTDKELIEALRASLTKHAEQDRTANGMPNNYWNFGPLSWLRDIEEAIEWMDKKKD